MTLSLMARAFWEKEGTGGSKTVSGLIMEGGTPLYIVLPHLCSGVS